MELQPCQRPLKNEREEAEWPVGADPRPDARGSEEAFPGGTPRPAWPVAAGVESVRLSSRSQGPPLPSRLPLQHRREMRFWREIPRCPWQLWTRVRRGLRVRARPCGVVCTPPEA